MLSRPSPASPAAGAFAWLDAGEPLVDIRNEPETAHFTIGEDVNASIGLLLDDLGNRASDPAGIASGVEWLASLLCLHHRQQIGRPGEAADVAREYPLRALLHDLPPGCRQGSGYRPTGRWRRVLGPIRSEPCAAPTAT